MHFTVHLRDVSYVSEVIQHIPTPSFSEIEKL